MVYHYLITGKYYEILLFKKIMKHQVRAKMVSFYKKKTELIPSSAIWATYFFFVFFFRKKDVIIKMIFEYALALVSRATQK